MPIGPLLWIRPGLVGQKEVVRRKPHTQMPPGYEDKFHARGLMHQFGDAQPADRLTTDLPAIAERRRKIGDQRLPRFGSSG